MSKEINHITQLTCRGSCRDVSEAHNPPFSCPLLLSPLTTVFATSVSSCSVRQMEMMITPGLKYLQLNLTSGYKGMPWVSTISLSNYEVFLLSQETLLGDTNLSWMTLLFLLSLCLPAFQPLLNRDCLCCICHPAQWWDFQERFFKSATSLADMNKTLLWIQRNTEDSASKDLQGSSKAIFLTHGRNKSTSVTADKCWPKEFWQTSSITLKQPVLVLHNLEAYQCLSQIPSSCFSDSDYQSPSFPLDSLQMVHIFFKMWC